VRGARSRRVLSSEHLHGNKGVAVNRGTHVRREGAKKTKIEGKKTASALWKESVSGDTVLNTGRDPAEVRQRSIRLCWEPSPRGDFALWGIIGDREKRDTQLGSP